MTINLRAAALQASYKNTYLAAHFRVTPATMSKWLNRRTRVPDEHKRELAGMLGVCVADLVPPAPSEHQNTAFGDDN